MNKIINIQVIATILFFSLIGTCNGSSRKNSWIFLSSPTSTSPTETDNSLVLNRTCVNKAIGYQINYPQGWQTNSGEVVNRCRVFDPRSAEVPEYTESIGKAIYLRVENNVSFEEIAKEDLSERHLSSKTTNIKDRRAVVIESESTGKALLRKGIRKYSYIVDLGNKTLIATTYDTTDSNYQQNKQILDRMMTMIKFYQ